MRGGRRSGLAVVLVGSGVWMSPHASLADVETPEALAARAHSRIEQQLPAGIAIESLSLLRSCDVEQSAPVGMLWRSAIEPGPAYVQLTVGGKPSQCWARVKFAAAVPVLVAARDLREGTVLAQNDVRSEVRALCDDGIQLEPVHVAGAPLLANIAKGAVLLSSQVELGPPIARGTQVAVVVRRGRATIHTLGILENKARPGSQTKVRVAGRLLRGRVTDPRTVTLVESSP